MPRICPVPALAGLLLLAFSGCATPGTPPTAGGGGPPAAETPKSPGSFVSAAAKLEAGIDWQEQADKSDQPDKAVECLHRAIESYRGALEVFSLSGSPQEWAETQYVLGIALNSLASRTTDDAKAIALAKEAVVAASSALKIYAPTDPGSRWARAQHSLADACRTLGVSTSGAEADGYFDRAIEAYQQALSHYQKEISAEDIGTAANHLGGMLYEKAIRRRQDQEASRLFLEAAAAYREQLSIYPPDDFPKKRAEILFQIGKSLAMTHNRFSTRTDSLMHLAAARTAFEESLKFNTRETSPIPWAELQYEIGSAAMWQAKLHPEPLRKYYNQQAIGSLQNTLAILTMTGNGSTWGSAQTFLGDSLELGVEEAFAEEKGSEIPAMIDQAVAAYHEALKFYTREKNFTQWASLHDLLSKALFIQAQVADPATALRVTREAVDVARRAAGVYDRAKQPDDWLLRQNNLALSLRLLAEKTDRNEAIALLNEAIPILQASERLYTDPLRLEAAQKLRAQSEARLAELKSGS